MRKLTIEDMQELAKQKEGVCLSIKYLGALNKLKWKCKNGHIWEATPCCIRNNGSWCHLCSVESRKSSIEDMQKLAKDKNGKCLSNIYINSNEKLEWECASGHKWKAKSNDIVTGYWCPKCAIENRAIKRRKSILDMQMLANERGGECVSTCYNNSYTKIKWKCNLNHEWWSTPSNVSSGTWCPECSASLSERTCRVYFEAIFQKTFPKYRPKWLRNPKTNYPLELDGYCEELGIAFEHQGEQHYTDKTIFIKTKKELKERKTIDKLKKKICELNNVILIQIPALNKRLKKKDLEEFIFNQISKNKIKISNIKLFIDQSKIYIK